MKKVKAQIVPDESVIVGTLKRPTDAMINRTFRIINEYRDNWPRDKWLHLDKFYRLHLYTGVSLRGQTFITAVIYRVRSNIVIPTEWVTVFYQSIEV
jgi:hypothetical protein